MTNMATLAVERPSRKPRYQELFDELRSQIDEGLLAPGSQMPTFVELREREGISRGTVEQVYMRLEREGLIRREQGRGTFVAERRPLATGQIGFIGTGFAMRHRFPYAAHIVEGIESVMQREELRIVLYSEDSLKGFDKVDGLIVCTGNPRKLAPLLPKDVPSIALVNPVPGISSVTADDYGGGKLGARELMALGHRRVACLMQNVSPQVRLRVLGMTDGLREAGIDPDPAWVCDPKLPFPVEGYREWGRESMAAWLQEGWADLGCTAIFTQNDLAAMGVIDALREAGLSVPRDVSVLSFDGTELCDYFSPRIAAVQVPLFRIGATGVEALLRQIKSRDTEEANTMLSTRFKAGESLRAISA